MMLLMCLLPLISWLMNPIHSWARGDVIKMPQKCTFKFMVMATRGKNKLFNFN